MNINDFNCIEFIKRHPRSNIFQISEMYEVYKKTKNYEPIFLYITGSNDSVEATLLVVIQKEHSGVLGKFSSRAIVWGGPLVKDNNLEILDLLLKKFCKQIGKIAIYSQFRNLWKWSDEEITIFKNNGFVYEDHLDIIHDISQPVEKQLMKMHTGRRKNISRAVKNEVEFDEISTVSELEMSLFLISDTYKKIKLPIPDKSYFISAFECLKNKGYVKFFKASLKNSIIAVRFVFCYNNLIYDWFAGADEKYLDKYPNDFLPWKVMEWGHENGFLLFDFGGAGKPNVPYGVREYKLKFGGDLITYGRFEKVHRPFMLKVGKMGFELYKRFKYVCK